MSAPQRPPSRSREGLLPLLLVVLIWASSFLVTKIALRGLPPATLTAARFVIALTILAPGACRRGYRPRMTFQWRFIRFGLTGVALFYGLQNAGLAYTSAGSASLIHAATPAVVTAMAVLLLGERVPARTIVGIALAVAGAMLVAVAGGHPADAQNPLLGGVLLGGSVLAWGLYSVDGRRLAAREHPLVSTTASIGAGLLLLVPAALMELAQAGLPRPDPASLWATVYLGAVASGGALLLWNTALTSWPASQAAVFINLVPVVGAALAIASGERMVPLQFAGGALALVGVWLAGATRT